MVSKVDILDQVRALHYCFHSRKVAVMKSTGKFVVCDRGNERSRMQIFTKHGHFVRKIAIRYIDIVAGLAITRDGNIVAVDSVTPTIFVIMEHGELLRWFDCAGGGGGRHGTQD